MPDRFADVKRTNLQKRRAALQEEYAAVNDQISRTLSDVDRLRLRRQAEALEQEMAGLEQELAAADASPEAPAAPPPGMRSEGRITGAGAPTAANSNDACADLRRSLGRGEVCAFVCEGLSIGAGLPGWYDLIAELAARIGHELPPARWATGDALIDAAQTYVNRQGLHSLISHLKDRLDTRGVQPTAAHRALARLPISLVFTANFDDLLERAFRDAGKRVEVIVKDSTIPFMRRAPDAVNIVKLYGALDQPETIVLARQQYESYFLQRPRMVELLKVELSRSDTLYLGWSGGDPYFKLVSGELLSRFGQMMRPGYAVMFDVTGAQRDELRRKQIRLVELPAGDRTMQLAAWLEGLVAPSVTSPTPAGQITGSGSISDTPVATEKGHTLPFIDIQRRLVDVLLRIPAMETFSGRTSLLDGLPDPGLVRDQNIARLDLNRMVGGLEKMGWLAQHGGAPPLIVLVDNALAYVPSGGEIAGELNEVKRLLAEIEKR